MKVFVYKVNGDEIHDDELSKYYKKIDIKKRKQIENYVDDYDKSKCFIAHLLIYMYFKGNINYKYNCNGKIFNTKSTEQFNISYSKDYVVAAITNENIGIDIEKINQIQKKELDYYATDNEKEIFRTKLEYTELWCLKESYLKYLGIGITKDLKKIEFEKNNNKYICKNNQYLKINILNIEKDYICAFITNKTEKIVFKNIDINKIKSILKKIKNI